MMSVTQVVELAGRALEWLSSWVAAVWVELTSASGAMAVLFGVLAAVALGLLLADENRP